MNLETWGKKCIIALKFDPEMLQINWMIWENRNLRQDQGSWCMTMCQLLEVSFGGYGEQVWGVTLDAGYQSLWKNRWIRLNTASLIGWIWKMSEMHAVLESGMCRYLDGRVCSLFQKDRFIWCGPQPLAAHPTLLEVRLHWSDGNTYCSKRQTLWSKAPSVVLVTFLRLLGWYDGVTVYWAIYKSQRFDFQYQYQNTDFLFILNWYRDAV